MNSGDQTEAGIELRFAKMISVNVLSRSVETIRETNIG